MYYLYYDEVGTILTVSNSNDDVGNYIEISYEIFTDLNEGNLNFHDFIVVENQLIKKQAQPDQLPELFTGGKRGIHRPCTEGQGANKVCRRPCHHHRGHGLPGQRTRRNGRCRSGSVVRPELRQPQTEG